jgi:hypothetical protein
MMMQFLRFYDDGAIRTLRDIEQIVYQHLGVNPLHGVVCPVLDPVDVQRPAFRSTSALRDTTSETPQTVPVAGQWG